MIKGQMGLVLGWVDGRGALNMALEKRVGVTTGGKDKGEIRDEAGEFTGVFANTPTMVSTEQGQYLEKDIDLHISISVEKGL